MARLCAMTGAVLSGLALGTVMSDETGSPSLTAAALVGGPLVQLVLARHLPATSDPTAAAHRDDRHGDDPDEYGDPAPAARLSRRTRFLFLAGGRVPMAAASGGPRAAVGDRPEGRMWKNRRASA
ncbi:hypothetical protein [Streptomyces sp. NPDC000983]|uniref:hypothetical protein n=1 Tax=Streptomyces sp. NPDC000983 TaxID=3154373 RepID=UPI003333B6D5